MPMTPEEPMPIEETYRDLLREAVKVAGGQYPVADLAKVNQATISRTLKAGSKATYTTLAKLSRALKIPPPVVPVRDAEHERWCRLGARLADEKPTAFAMMLQAATETIGLSNRPTQDEAMDRLRAVVAHPIPGKRR